MNRNTTRIARASAMLWARQPSDLLCRDADVGRLPRGVLHHQEELSHHLNHVTSLKHQVSLPLDFVRPEEAAGVEVLRAREVGCRRWGLHVEDSDVVCEETQSWCLNRFSTLWQEALAKAWKINAIINDINHYDFLSLNLNIYRVWTLCLHQSGGLQERVEIKRVISHSLALASGSNRRMVLNISFS